MGQSQGSKTENDNHNAHVINLLPIFLKPSKRVAGVSRITETLSLLFLVFFLGVIANWYLLDLLKQVDGSLGSFLDARRIKNHRETPRETDNL